MKARLCRWIGCAIGKPAWASANRVKFTCPRCGNEVEVVRR